MSQYLANASTVAVLEKSDLSLDSTLVTGIPRTNTATDSGYSGIDVAADGRIYLVDQLYQAPSAYTPPATSFNPTPQPMGVTNVNFDRVLVSSRLADRVAPEITCPPDITTNADPGQPYATLNPGTATAMDDIDGSIPVTGTRSDSRPLTDTYPVGMTIITWSAMDSGGNLATCEQMIMVIANNGPRLMKQYVMGQLQMLRPLSDKGDDDKLKKAIESLAKSLLSQYWIDDSHLVESTGTKVFDAEKDAAKKIAELSKKNKSGLTPAQLDPLNAQLVSADRTLATTAISDAIAANGNPAKISKAQSYLAKGDNDAAAGKPDAAINDYKDAWKEAVAAY